MVRYYENTFWNNCVNQYVTLDNLLKALSHELIKEKQLPKNIRNDLNAFLFQKFIANKNK